MPEAQLILIKQYARSRLYDATNRCYVTVQQLRRWKTKGITFSVIDVETGADITAALLA